MKEKGIDIYLETAKTIKEKYPNAEFHICGFCDDEKLYVYGAMELYLDFINIFLRILSLFGKNKD